MIFLVNGIETDLSVEEALRYGFDYAGCATAATDPVQKQIEMQKALSLLAPLSAPEHGAPKASFGMGVLAQDMAMHVLNSPAIGQEERETNAFLYFAKAAEYYGIAAGMDDDQQDLTPARAMNSPARLHELGVLGEKDFDKAFTLTLNAAEAGFAEAQINVALMYYRGEGTTPSLVETDLWLNEAYKNRQQLLFKDQDVLDSYRAEIKTKLKNEPLLPTPKHGTTPGGSKPT